MKTLLDLLGINPLKPLIAYGGDDSGGGSNDSGGSDDSSSSTSNDDDKGFFESLIDDVAMGIGAKEKTQDYIDRTAETIARNEGSAAASNYAAGQADKGFEDNYNAPADTSHTVSSGDTLGQIALDNGTTVAAIANASGIALSDVNNISVGQSLTIPGTTSGDTSNVYAGLPQSVFDEKTPDNAVTVDGNFYDQFGNPHGTKSARDNADVQYGRQESWSNPSNWIITSNERGELDKQYIGSEPAPSGGNYTVPSFAAIDSGTSKPGSSLDVVVEGSKAYVTDKAGEKFDNVEQAAASDIVIDRKVASYEDPSNYRIDTNQQDDLVRVYVGDEGLPPISYNTPSWEAVDTAQESASDKDQYYDLTFVDGQRKVLDSYGNAFDTPTEATSNDLKIVDHLKPESYEVIEAGGIANAIYTGEYGTPDVQAGSAYRFETPSVTDVLNATTYKDKPYRVEYDPEENVTSAFVGDQRLAGQYGTELNDELIMSYKKAYDAGYGIDTPEIEAQVDALMFGGEMFLDENKDGVPDMEISEEVQALSPMNFKASVDNKAAFAAASQVGSAPAPRTPGNRAGVVVEDSGTFGSTVKDGFIGFGDGVVNSVASGLTGVGALQKQQAAAEVEALAFTLSTAGNTLSVYQDAMNELMSDENIARGLMAADDPVEYLKNFEVEVQLNPEYDGSLVGTINAAMLQGRIQNEQQRILTATEEHIEAMKAAGVPMDATYWGALADTVREKGSELIGDPQNADSGTYKVLNGLGSAITFIGLSAPALLAGPAAAPALAATFAATGGALVNAGSMYDEAYAFTLSQTDPATGQPYTPEKADAIALQGTGYATLIGTLEGIPVARALGFVPPQFGSQVAEFFTDIIAEGGQEGLNQTLNNLTAQGIWDPERGMFDGTVDAAMLGGIVGGAISGPARMTKSMVDGLKANGYSDTEIDMIEESDGGIVTGEMSPERIGALLDRGYTIEQISGVFGNLTGTNTINAMTDAPQMTIEGLAANSAFQDTVIKTGAGDPAIMYGNPANNMFSATAPSPDALPVYLDVKNPFTIESIGTPKGKETLTEVLGSSRADALISEFRQNGNVTLTGADVQKVAESGYDGVIDNDSGKVYVADNSSVYSVTDPETTTEETVVATKPEWKTQLDEAFYLTGSIDMDLAKQVEQEFGVSPFEINEHYQQITASDAAWEKRLLGDYLTKGYIDLDTMLKAEEDFGVSMQDLGNYAEYLDSDLSVYNDAMFADQIKEVQDLTASQTSLQSEVTSLTNELSAVEEDLIEMTSNRDLDSEAAATAIAKQEQLSTELAAKKEELAGVEKTLGETQTALEAETGARATAEQSVISLTSDLESANSTITDLQSSLDAANGKVSTLNTAIEGLNAEVATAEAASTAANDVVSKLTNDLQFKNEEITGLEAEVKAAEEAVLAKQGELDTASANAETSAETITTLTSEITALEEAKTGLDGDLSTAIGERDSLQGTLDERTTERDTLQEALTSSNTQLEAATTQLNAANTQVTDLTTQKEALTKEVATLTTDLGAANTNLTAAQATIGTQDTTITDLNTNIGTLQEQLTTATNEVSTLSNQLEAAQTSQTATAEQKAALAEQLDAAQKEATSLLSDITALEGQRDTLQADLTAAQSTIGTQEATIGNQAETIATLTTDLGAANQDIGSLTEQLGTANESVTALEGQLEAANNSLTATQTEKDTIAANLDTARENARALTESLSDRTKERDNLQVSLNDTKTTLSNTVTLANTLQNNLDASNAEITTLETQLDTAQANVESLTNTLTDATALQELTEGEKLDLQNDLIASQNDVAALTDTLDSRTTERDSIQTQLTETQAELTASTQLTETLQGNLDTAQANILGLETQLGDSQALQQLTEEQRAALEQTLAEEQANAASLETQLGEVSSAFDITQTQLDFAQGATTYVNTQLDQNVAEDALVADLVTRGYTADNAQALVNEVQQTRFEQSELARITDARRSAAYVPFGAGPIGEEEDEVTYPDYGPPGMGAVQPQAQQPYPQPAAAYQPPTNQPVYEAPRFAPFSRADATPIAGGPAVELDQFGQPILSFGPSGRPLGSYVTMPTSAGPFDPYLMEMPEAPTFNPQQPVVRPPFPQQPQPVINQGIGGLGRK